MPTAAGRLPAAGKRTDGALLPWPTAASRTVPAAAPSSGRGGTLTADPRNRTVANIKSQIKRNRQNERRRLRNKSVRSEMRTRTKTALAAAETGAEDALDALQAAVRRIDKAAAQGVIHKNQAANRKSRLMRRIAKLS